ncbi:MAG: 2-dehydropantoate 2-reductase [Sutterellaceae bacterium]|nr:2-dehydropantoate 2-reductase [Burkholderiaceae bacterium]MDW8428965.1 2-dehydropantoate 2-reductase [Sutterellaceae bacterium]
MRVLVFGAGGVGGYFGAQLARAGHDVAFVARGAHLQALRQQGLRIESTLAPLHLPVVTADDDPARLPTADIVMFCTKLWDVEAAAARLAPALAADTLVIPFQNGVESHLILRPVLGEARVAGGVAQISATIKAPGVIEQSGPYARLRVGAFLPAQAPRVQAFAQAARAAGIDVEVVEDIERALWEKFVFLSPVSGLTCLTRQPIGVVRSDPDIRPTLVAAIEETVAVARARGVRLGEDIVAATLRIVDWLPPSMRASMLHDLTHGNRLEAPWLAGAVARMAREAGLPAPVNAAIYAALKPYVDGTR